MQRIGQWSVPHLGTVKTLPAQDLPIEALFSSQNMLARDAVLQQRPGLQLAKNVTIDVFTGVPTGAINYRDFFNKPYILVGTTTGIFAWTGTTRRTLTMPLDANGNAPAFRGVLSGSLDHPSRFATIQLGNVIHVIHTNGVDHPMIWDGVAGSFVPVTGNPIGPESQPGDPKPPPKWTDIATIGDRIIGIIPPYDIRWGRDAEVTLWPESNFKSLAETTDPLVCIRALGTLGGVVYKQDSVWAVFASGASDAAFYRFEFRGFYEGPAGVQAVADGSGVHFYMTTTGRVAMFNGSQLVWVADGIWPEVREDIDFSKAHRVVAWYDTKHNEVWFVYPRRSDDDGLPRGLVILSLPRPEVGKNVLGAFVGVLSPFAEMPQGAATIITQNVSFNDTTINVVSTEGFEESGIAILQSPTEQYAWMYTSKTPTTMTGLAIGSFNMVAGSVVSQAKAPVKLAVTTATPYRMVDRDPKIAVFAQASAGMMFNLSESSLGCDDRGVPIGNGRDYGAPFPFHWQTGLQAAPAGEAWRMDSVEPFFRMDANYGDIEFRPVRSYTLPVPGGELGTPVTFSLEERRAKALKGINSRGRFQGIRFQYEPKSIYDDVPFINYYGALVNGHRVEGTT